MLPHLFSIDGELVGDDEPYLRDNASVHTIGAALRLFGAEYPADGLYRPLTGIAYALQHALWGLHPVGYHVVQLLLWAATALVVDAWMRRQLAPGPALAVTLLFLAHPVHCEVADHITGESDLLSGLFLFAVLLLRARPLLALPLFVASVLAKESGAVLPGLLLVEALALRPSEKISRAFRSLVPYALALAAIVALRVYALDGVVGPREPVLDDPRVVAKAATLGAVSLRYLGLLFFPGVLAVDRFYRIGVGAHHRFDLDAAVGFALVLAIAAVGIADLVRSRRAGRTAFVAFGIGFSFVAMAPYGHLVPFGALMAERFLHVATLGFAWTLVVLLHPFLARVGRAQLAPWLVGAAVLSWSVRSALRSIEWRDAYAIYAPVAERFPDDPLSRFALGHVLLQKGRVAEARAELETALALYPHSGAGRNLLGITLLEQKDLDGAEAQFRLGSEEPDDRANAFNGLGTVEARRGHLRSAQRWYAQAVAADPAMADARDNLADTEAAIGRAETARETELRGLRDPALLRAACAALEDEACVRTVDARESANGRPEEKPE